MAKLKPGLLVWIASSRRDMRAMPREVRRSFGVALYAVQMGLTPPVAKVLKGFGGGGVLELIEDDAGGTYRAVYTVQYFECGLRAARVSKEIETRQANFAARYRSGQRANEARQRDAHDEDKE